MARYPEPGAVKTRLAAVLGSQRACALYVSFLRDLASALDSPEWRLLWAVHPGSSSIADFVAGAAQIPQRGIDLGERMLNAFADAFASGPQSVFMLGSDVPHFGPERARNAFAMLEEHDVVLVPSLDGGYCGIGLRRPLDLFTGIQMSTNRVYEETMERCSRLGLRVQSLPSTFDVDDIHDLERLRSLIDGGEVNLPAVARELV